MKVKNTFIAPHWLIDEAGENQTEFVIVLASNKLHDDDVKKIHQILNEHNVVIVSSNALSSVKATEIFISTSAGLAWQLFKKLLSLELSKEVDIAVLPVSSRKKKLLVCDMDSTIIQSETLDDIAENVGIGEQVKVITARAMSGELDFRQALNERISLLAGTTENIFAELANTVQYNSGAEKLIELARQNDLRTVLVSGGFEQIVKVVANRLGFDRYVCNCLEITNGKLTRKIIDPVVDGDTKLSILQEECRQLSIHPSQACAIGDGANDIQMLQAAGLGVGFQGKPLVRASTPYQINTTGLDTALIMMGIAE